MLPVAVAGLAAAFVMNLYEWNMGSEWFGMMLYDNYAVSFSGLLIFTTILLLALSGWHFRNEGAIIGDIYGLVIFVLAGGILMTSFSNLVLMFIGIEILSIALYILAGSRRVNIASNEASVKYFLMGSFASAVLLFGIALIFGATNSFSLTGISDYVTENEAHHSIFYVGVILTLIGMAFKIGVVPFHFWTPDVYQGSPTFITALMATVVKTAGIAAFYRLFDRCFSGIDQTWYQVLWVISAITILLANISAVLQNESKRMLAWSSVAHAGYLLLPLLALNEMSAPAIFYYSAAYSVASVTAFGVIMALSNTNNELAIDQFKGLFRSSPLLTLALIVSMFSLAGIPPLAGFFGKYFLFANAMSSNLITIVIIAIAGSLIGVYYYFRPVVFAFNQEAPAPQIEKLSFVFQLVLVIGTLLSILLGLFPDLLANLPN